MRKGRLSEKAELEYKERIKVCEELSKYYRSIIEEFERLFPLELHRYEPGTIKGGKWGDYNYFCQNIMPKEGKGRQDIVNLTILKEDSWNNFWQRWNKFKIFIPFL